MVWICTIDLDFLLIFCSPRSFSPMYRGREAEITMVASGKLSALRSNSQAPMPRQ
jgi:hypothetical protein